MKKLLLLALIPFISIAQETSVIKELKAFENFIGKTFKGEFSTSTPENPVYDIQQWERILNGKGIKTIHSVNNGLYGGESIMMWDSDAEEIKCWYFTTAGFQTTSSIKAIDGGFEFTEKVYGNKNGITEVRGTTHILENGNLKTSSEYLQHGKWVFGHEINYEEVKDEKVIFK